MLLSNGKMFVSVEKLCDIYLIFVYIQKFYLHLFVLNFKRTRAVFIW